MIKELSEHPVQQDSCIEQRKLSVNSPLIMSKRFYCASSSLSDGNQTPKLLKNGSLDQWDAANFSPKDLEADGRGLVFSDSDDDNPSGSVSSISFVNGW